MKHEIDLGHWVISFDSPERRFTLEVDDAKLHALIGKASRSTTGRTQLQAGAFVISVEPEAHDAAGPFYLHYSSPSSGREYVRRFKLREGAESYLAQYQLSDHGTRIETAEEHHQCAR